MFVESIKFNQSNMKSKYLILISICLMLSCKKNAGRALKQAKNNTDLGQVEKLFFSKNKFGRKADTLSQFSKHFTLNKDKNLSFQFALEKPLAASLQKLAPNLSSEELLDKGNFQFTLLVDDEIIRTDNLNKGAGTVSSKTEQLTHTIPLITSEPVDHWGWFLWLKFMKLSGGQDALSEGNHVLSIEVRPYLNDGALKVGDLLVKGSLAITVSDLPFDKNAIPVQTIAPNSGWTVSSDNYDRTKIKALNKKIVQNRFEKINGIVVVKQGELLIEEYFNGSRRDSLHDVRSVGKSFASTMMGIAIAEKYIKSEAVELKEFYDLKEFNNYSPAKDNVTLKSLLTMSSGFLGDDSDYSNPGNEELMYPTDDWVKFALDLPIQKDKIMGKDYSYFTAGTVLLGDIIHKSVPDGLVSYADKKLFSPMGITNYKWQYTPQNVGNTAGGIQLRAVDFAKYGQLYKSKGRWNDKQILTKSWVEKSLSKQVKQVGQNNGYYGYLFWNKTYTVNGKDYEVSFCTGNGGNKIFVFKEIPFVIVITSSAYGLPYAHANVDKMMLDYILPAILGEE